MGEIIHQLQDLRYLQWTKIRHSSGTAGSFLKSYDERGRKKVYYKLSDFDSIKGIVGHECVNELIVDRLLNLFQFPHVTYTLIHALITIESREYETYLCASSDFKEYGESKAAFEDYYQLERLQDEGPLEFCRRMNWQEMIYQMLYLDFLILNRDRHGANLEVLRNPRKKTIRLAPLFDHGLSFACRCRSDDELAAFDVMEDKKVQTLLGSSSVLENLRLIPLQCLKKMPKLKADDRKVLLDGLTEVLSDRHRNLIWEMLLERNRYIENLCNS